MGQPYYSGSVHTASFKSTGLTSGTAHDLIGVLASTTNRVRIRCVDLAAISSDQGSIGVQLLRGSSSTSGGATVTPVNLKGWSAAPTAGSSIVGPSTSLASTASQEVLYNGFFDENTFCYRPDEVEMPVLDLGQRFHVRTDDSAVSMQGTVTFEEIPKPGNL